MTTVLLADAGASYALGYVLGTLCCFGLTAIPFFYVLKSFMEEKNRGQRADPTLEEVLDDGEPRSETAIFKGDKVPDWQIAARVKATRAVAKFIAFTDNWYEHKYLVEIVEEAFQLVKKAIERRTIQDVERHVTADCLDDLSAEIKKLRKARQRRIFRKLVITNFQLIQIEMPVGKENHTFTVLLTAKSRDYIEDEEEDIDDLSESEQFERKKQRKLYAYQEFWTFRRTDKRWLVELIRPSSDVESVLQSKNVLAKIDYEEFAKDADKETLQHVVGR